MKRIRDFLFRTFVFCLIGTVLMLVLVLAGFHDIAGPLAAVFLLGLILSGLVDLILSWFGQSKPRRHGFEVIVKSGEAKPVDVMEQDS